MKTDGWLRGGKTYFKIPKKKHGMLWKKVGCDVK